MGIMAVPIIQLRAFASTATATSKLIRISQVKSTSKSEKAKLIKKLHFTNKELFGELLETRKEKLKNNFRDRSSVNINEEGESHLRTVRRINQGPKVEDAASSCQVETFSGNVAVEFAKVDPLPNKPSQQVESDWMFNVTSKGWKKLVISSPEKVKMITKTLKSTDMNTAEETSQAWAKNAESVLKETENPSKIFPLDNNMKQEANINNVPEIICEFPIPDIAKSSFLDPKPKYPSVTRILTATMSKEQLKILKLWEDKMIKQLGEEGFKAYKEELFRNGKLLHSNIHALLQGQSESTLNIPEPISGHWKSLNPILKSIRRTVALESHVIHPQLHYSGIIDCIAFMEDKLLLIDWKTSEKPKPFISNTFDTPLQVAAYLGAVNFDPNYTFKVTQGLLVYGYKNGNDCQVFKLESEHLLKYWRLWVRRLKLFQNT